MKKFVLFGLIAVLLCGCGAEQTMETVADELGEPETPVMREMYAEIPGEAAAPVMEGEGNRYYLCDGYEISMETFPSGDLKNTIRQLSGYDLEDLTVVETEQDASIRYDFVWATEGENGERLGRAAVIDDGNYHYTLSVLRDAETTKTSQVVWRTVFESFSLA